MRENVSIQRGFSSSQADHKINMPKESKIVRIPQHAQK